MSITFNIYILFISICNLFHTLQISSADEIKYKTGERLMLSDEDQIGRYYTAVISTALNKRHKVIHVLLARVYFRSIKGLTKISAYSVYGIQIEKLYQMILQKNKQKQIMKTENTFVFSQQQFLANFHLSIIKTAADTGFHKGGCKILSNMNYIQKWNISRSRAF